MRRLAAAQAGGDFSSATAPRHLLTVMTQLLVDQLEHPDGFSKVAAHGTWLSQQPPGNVAAGFSAHMNSLLLTAAVNADAGLFAPGTVFRSTNPAKFEAALGKSVFDLDSLCCTRKSDHPKLQDWMRYGQPVLVELSPACDVAQGKRVSSLLIAGVLIPAAHKSDVKTGPAFEMLPSFKLRWPIPGFAEQDVILTLCHRFKVTLPAGESVDWLEPWFRLRELPLASIRNGNVNRSGFAGGHFV